MSALEDSSSDSSSPPRMPCKRLFEDGPHFDLKHPKVEAVRSFPKMFGATFCAGLNSKDNESNNKSFEHDLGTLTEVIVQTNYLQDNESNKSLENDLGTLTEVIVEANYLHYSDDLYSTKCGKNEFDSLQHDSGTLYEVIVEAENYLNYSGDRYSTKCGKQEWASSLGEMEQDCDLKDVALDYDINIKTGVEGGNDEPSVYLNENQSDLINLRILHPEDPHAAMVVEVLQLFEKYYKEITKEHENLEPTEERKTMFAHFEAAKRLKKEGKYILTEKPFGHIPGVKIGDEFRFRSQLVVVGLHRQLVAGIDYVALGEKKYATSVVDAGRYENTAKTHDVLIYSGQGGNIKIYDNYVDQKLEKGNLALMNSMKMGYPVRVTYKRKGLGYEMGVVYVYDGLYMVTRAWKESNRAGKLVYKFELHRMPDQPRSLKKYDIESKKAGTQVKEVCMVGYMSRGKEKIPISTMNGVEGREFCLSKDISQGKEKIPVGTRKGMVDQEVSMEVDISGGKENAVDYQEVCMEQDISGGKEKIPIRAMNGMDDDQPPTFAYVTCMVYPSWYQTIEPAGCDCVDGCLDSRQCLCVLKNRGEIPYNENGSIMKATAKVHECGPMCKCSPTCMNRVSQLGPRYRLEIFKTKNRGWGVRSRDVIPSGGFVCEYIGEFLREKEADLRVGSDEYLFDICKGSGGSGNGFSIDAAVYGNMGRFFNHSCSPNMYAQKVIYDHDDHRMPHIMFFATEEIPPLKELSYDYNYKLGTVSDADGNIKTKYCYCGSHKCKKRLY